MVKLHHTVSFPWADTDVSQGAFLYFSPHFWDSHCQIIFYFKFWKMSLEKRLFSCISERFHVFINHNELCCSKGLIIYNNKDFSELQWIPYFSPATQDFWNWWTNYMQNNLDISHCSNINRHFPVWILLGEAYPILKK